MERLVFTYIRSNESAIHIAISLTNIVHDIPRCLWAPNDKTVGNRDTELAEVNQPSSHPRERKPCLRVSKVDESGAPGD